MKNFTLHERLRNDTIEVTDLKLCRVLLMNDASFPWLILVPMRHGVTEIYELSKEDRAALMDEAAAASRAISRAFTVEKINIGALGNLVPQLHVHVVGRRSDDRAWPGPVWGSGAGAAYSSDAVEHARSVLLEALKDELPWD